MSNVMREEGGGVEGRWDEGKNGKWVEREGSVREERVCPFMQPDRFISLCLFTVDDEGQLVLWDSSRIHGV